MTIDEWLRNASNKLADEMIPTARLDAEIILAHSLNHPRTWLHAHGDHVIDARRKDIADARIQLRIERVPVAYIIGHKEFYSRRFIVSPSVLIPRADSEVLIELVRAHASATPRHIVDVGTGSGALGVTLAALFPDAHVTLLDISKDALSVARQNVDAHGLRNVRLVRSDLLTNYPLRADILVANLPYVNEAWTDTSPELRHEPSQALYAAHGGLKLIEQLIKDAPHHIAPRGLLVLEADTSQHETIRVMASISGFVHLETKGLGLAFTYTPPVSHQR